MIGSSYCKFRIFSPEARSSPEPCCVMAKIGTRALLFFLMIVLSAATLVTGIVLFLWPSGPRSGQFPFLGLVKHEWSDWHTWLSLAAGATIVAHIILNRRCAYLYSKCVVRGTTRYLEEAVTNTER